MNDYEKSLRIQELEDQRIDLMWEYLIAEISIYGSGNTIHIRQKVRELNKKIKELQNG